MQIAIIARYVTLLKLKLILYAYLSSVSMHIVQSSPPISAARETMAAIKPEAVEAASPRAIQFNLISIIFV
jgi:hypothetical protein